MTAAPDHNPTTPETNVTRELAPCGTQAAYQRHRRNGETPCRPCARANSQAHYRRLPEDYPGQAADAAAIARLFVSEGVRYSFLSYGALALWRWGFKAERLARWIARTQSPRRAYEHPDFLLELPVEAICSVLVDQCWTLAGHEVVTGTRPQIVTPGMLAMQVWNRPGVVRGGDGVLG